MNQTDIEATDANIIEASLDILLRALVALKATGADGFEGLIAVVLGTISGEEFRLAASGSQHGLDGGAIHSKSEIAFEAKLYTGTINKIDVISKVGEVGAKGSTDLWVLGATIPISKQLADTISSLAEKLGLPILILDWEANTLPRLAIACVAAKDSTLAFLRKNLKDKVLIAGAENALKAIALHSEFFARFEHIKAELRGPTVGLSLALKSNRRWLEGVFSDKRRSKQLLGQMLTPLADVGMPVLPREEVTGALMAQLQVADDSILAIIGDEGCGKSWSLAQSVMALPKRPLVIIIPAKEIKDTGSYQNLENLFIGRLLAQTGDTSDDNSRRWKRRLSAWRKESKASPNLIVWIDGLNENTSVDWHRWLDGASSELHEIRGKLVFTSRRKFYADHLERCIVAPVNVVVVPEWSDGELDALLLERGISSTQISGEVRASLRNPRILGIAFNLFATSQIIDFQELSVSRLLFEYIHTRSLDDRLGEASNIFARRLAKHAEATLEKANRQETEDLTLFDIASFAGTTSYSLSTELLYASEGQFYKPRPDATSYELSDHGLNLALGLAMVRELENAEASGRDVSDKLQEILEPVEALDRTADVVFNAMIVACVDPGKSDAVRVPLIVQYLRLQNTDQTLYPAFAAIGRVAASACMQAFYQMMISAENRRDTDWLLSALRRHRQYDKNWEIISRYIKEWLRQHSLDPHLGTFPTMDQSEKQEAQEKAAAKLAEKLTALTPTEQEYVNRNLVRNDAVDTAFLIENAFLLLAGMPLADFADSLVSWVLGRNLNSSIHAREDGFDYLIGFNREDWIATRDALLTAVAPFDKPDVSRTGLWTLVHVWRAIDSEDLASKAEALTEPLFPEELKPYRKGWRLIENYCEIDPCDPAESAPNNISRAVEELIKADFSQLYRGLFVTQENHLLENTSTGLARFAPTFAVETQRRVIDIILGLDALSFRLAVHHLEAVSPILNADDIARLLDKASQFSVAEHQTDEPSRYHWIASQFALLGAMPHLSGGEQLAALMDLPPHGAILLNTTALFVAASEQALEAAFEAVRTSSRTDNQMTILSFALTSDTPLSPRSQEIISEFMSHSDNAVRCIAFQVAVHFKDPTLIKAAVDTGWAASMKERQEHKLEIFYGSQVMIEAARLGLLSVANVIERISPELYGYAAKALGVEAVQRIARILDTAIQKALCASMPFSPPVAEENINAKKPDGFRFLSISEPEEKLSIEEQFKRFNESAEDYSARQKRAQESFNRFLTAMTQQQAALICTYLGRTPIRAAYEASPATVLAWADAFNDLPERKRSQIRNIGLAVANAISGGAPEKALRLFEQLGPSLEILKLTYGTAKIPAQTVYVWSAADNAVMDGLRTSRLSQAASNHEIAEEIAAALMAGKLGFLLEYIKEALTSDVPVVVARAVTVCGFLDNNIFAAETIERYVAQKGLVGDAARAAQYAYERNMWARHWFDLMCKADESQDYWRYSTLFHKIIDFRYDLWEAEFPRTGKIIRRFEPLLTDGIKKRIEKWNKKRSEKLFAMNVPHGLYLSI
ncbi:MAG: hypothetical protein QM647_08795 [Asticcacaulis sp.]|uniref:hypothetical protein n=1 Tax=Asticcacaulis sp. TaxID=1872648 RepID=UPI0039E698FE